MKTPNLHRFVDDLNRMRVLFKEPRIDLESDPVTATRAIRNALEFELSPENLCCSGELTGQALQDKVRYLNAVAKEFADLTGNRVLVSV